MGQVPLPLIVVFLALAGAASPFYMGGLSSFIPGSIPDVCRAFAYDSLSYNWSAVAAPAVVAVMATFLPGVAAVGALATSAVMGALIVAGVALKPHRATEASPWHPVKAGLHRMFRHRPPHKAMMVGFFVAGLFTAAATLDLGIIWTVLAIGTSGVFTAASAAAMLTVRSRPSPPHLRSQICT